MPSAGDSAFFLVKEFGCYFAEIKFVRRCTIIVPLNTVLPLCQVSVIIPPVCKIAGNNNNVFLSATLCHTPAVIEKSPETVKELAADRVLMLKLPPVIEKLPATLIAEAVVL
jgi:hypothetical protein